MNTDSNGFEISIDFTPGEGDPTRVFRAMSGLIEALQSIDTHLMSTMSVSLEAKLVLDDIEKGSLRAILHSLISGIPDDALKNVDWKKALGHFLHKSKYAILRWLEKRDKINDRDEVRVLEGELLEIAQATDVKRLPAYAPVPAEALLSDIHSVQESLSHLEREDSATYRDGESEVTLNRNLEISNEVVRDVLTKEVISSSGIKILKVKKPDYLGQSMWVFLHEGRAIEAKILDEEWLVLFQARSIEVRPGDSLKVELLEAISYGYEGEIVHRQYEVQRVIEVIRAPTQTGMNF